MGISVPSNDTISLRSMTTLNEQAYCKPLEFFNEKKPLMVIMVFLWRAGQIAANGNKMVLVAFVEWMYIYMITVSLLLLFPETSTECIILSSQGGS